MNSKALFVFTLIITLGVTLRDIDFTKCEEDNCWKQKRACFSDVACANKYLDFLDCISGQSQCQVTVDE
jgi:hypothetical protein